MKLRKEEPKSREAQAAAEELSANVPQNRAANVRGCEKMGTVPSADRTSSIESVTPSGVKWTVPIFSQQRLERSTRVLDGIRALFAAPQYNPLHRRSIQFDR